MYLLNKLSVMKEKLNTITGIGMLILFVCVSGNLYAQTNNSALQVWNPAAMTAVQADWLIQKPTIKAAVYQSLDGKDIVLYNGLLKREFRLQPNLVCTDFTNLVNGQQLLRATAPEAKLIINGHQYAVGGLKGQTERAYFKKEWLQQMVEITDPDVLAKSGKRFHPIVMPGAVDDEVPGMVFQITAAELAAADSYEVSDYKRVSAQLASGKTAWVYVKA